MKHPAGKRMSNAKRMIVTECQTLDEAIDAIRQQQINAKMVATKKSRPVTLKQLFSCAKMQINSPTYKRRGQKTPPKPHPLKDLPDEEKCAKMREMYESGQWGIGHVAYRRLARAFRVPLGAAVVWLEDVTASW